MHEALETLEAQGVHLDALRVRGLPVRRRGGRLHRRARAGVRGRAEPRRPAAHAAHERRRRRSGQARRRCCTTTARRSPRASSSARSPRGSRALDVAPLREAARMTYHRQAQAASSRAADQRARLHPARLRGHGLDALRRLRPRFDQRRDHPGLLRARPAAAPHRQAVRHRLLVEDAGLFPRRLRTASTACTAACRRC